MKIIAARARIHPRSFKSPTPRLSHLASSHCLKGDVNSSVSPWGARSEHTCLPFNLLCKPSYLGGLWSHSLLWVAHADPSKAAAVGLAVISHGASVTRSPHSSASHRTIYSFLWHSPPCLFLSHRPASSEAGSFPRVEKSLKCQCLLISLSRSHYYESTWYL